MSEIAPRKWKYSFVTLGYLSLFALGFLDNLRGPYFPAILTELSMNDNQGGLFFATTSAVAFLASWLTQHLIFRWGAIKTLGFGVWVTAASAIAFGFSDSFFQLLLSAALFGVGFGTVSVAMNMAISEGAPLIWRRRVLSGLHGIYGLASFFSPLLVSVLEASHWNWRKGFILAAIPPFLIGLFSIFLSINTKMKMPVSLPLSQTEKLAGKNKRLALWMALSVSIYLFGELTLSTRLVLHLVRTFTWDIQHSSLYLGLFFAGLFLSRFSFLVIKIRFSVLALIHGCLALSIIFFICGLTLHPLFLSLCGLSMGPFVPAAIEHLMQSFGRYQTEVVSYTMAFFSAVVVGLQFVLGWTTEEFSILTAMWWGPLGLGLSWLMYTLGYKRAALNVDDLKT